MDEVPELFKEVNRLLTNRLLPAVKYKGNIKKRRISFGLTNLKYGRPPHVCLNNLKYSELYLALRHLGDAICPFAYDAMTVTQHGQFPELDHTVKGSLGNSMIVTGGDYRAGDFVLEGERINTQYRPLVFDMKRGHRHEPFVGFRWSIVFFKLEVSSKWLDQFPADVNDPNREWSLMDPPEFA